MITLVFPNQHLPINMQHSVYKSKFYLVPFLGFEIWKLKRLHLITIDAFEVEKPKNCILDDIEPIILYQPTVR